MVRHDPNMLDTRVPNNSPLKSSGFHNPFAKYAQPTITNAAYVPTGQRNGGSSSTPSPRNLHNPSLHAFPNSFKHHVPREKNSHSTLHPSQSYPVLPSSSIDDSDIIAPPIDGRNSTPPNLQELSHSSSDRDFSVDDSCTVNSSSSSSSPSSGPSDSQPPKKSYLDAALVSSNNQEPNRKPSLLNGFSRNGSSNLASASSTGSSSLQSQPSKDQTSDRSTAPVGSLLKPPARSITFGTFDHSLLLPWASVSFRHSDSFASLTRTSTSNKHISVPTSCTTTTILLSASSEPLGKETVAPSSKDALKVREGLDPMSGRVLGKCQSCNNPLKHCCWQTIIDNLSGSRSP